MSEIEIADDGSLIHQAPLDGRYVVNRKIGQGSLATVSHGTHLALNQSIAIKQFTGLLNLHRGELTQEMRRNLRHAIERNASIDSDFVLRIVDVNVDAGRPIW